MCCEQLFGYDVDDIFAYQTGAPAAALHSSAWRASANTDPAQPNLSASETAAWASCASLCSSSSSSTLSSSRWSATRVRACGPGPAVGMGPSRLRPRLRGAPGYLKKASPIGTMRFSLLRPLANPKYDHPDSESAFRPQTEVRRQPPRGAPPSPPPLYPWDASCPIATSTERAPHTASPASTRTRLTRSTSWSVPASLPPGSRRPRRWVRRPQPAAHGTGCAARA